MESPPADDERSFEDLARRARRAAAAESTRWPRHWNAFAAGQLPAAEVARLRAAAASSARARAAFEVFRPLGAGFCARMVERILALRRTHRRTAGARAFLKAHHRRWPRLAAAAAVVLSLYWLGPPDVRRVTPEAVVATAPLPAYELSVAGAAGRRSPAATPEIATLAAGISCTVVLYPAAPATRPVAGRLYAVRGATWSRWQVELEVAPSGALRAAGPLVDDLSLEPGPWLLVAAVGRPSALPPVAELRAALEGGEGTPADGGWQMVVAPVRVEP